MRYGDDSELAAVDFDEDDRIGESRHFGTPRGGASPFDLDDRETVRERADSLDDTIDRHHEAQAEPRFTAFIPTSSVLELSLCQRVE